MYIPNPLQCFNCQRFGHHENSCPELPGSVCEKCGMGDFDHLHMQCLSQAAPLRLWRIFSNFCAEKISSCAIQAQKTYYNIGCKCIVIGCFYLRFTINRHRIILKCKEIFKIIEKIHLNRQSGMIFACSLCIFDVISSVGGSHFSILS